MISDLSFFSIFPTLKKVLKKYGNNFLFSKILQFIHKNGNVDLSKN